MSATKLHSFGGWDVRGGLLLWFVAWHFDRRPINASLDRRAERESEKQGQRQLPDGPNAHSFA